MQLEPRLTPDQIAGARFLASRRVAYLADVPGLGKTGQFVRALDLVCADTATIICPPALRTNMQREIDLWSFMGRDVTVIASEKDDVPKSGVIAVSYSLAARPVMLAKLRKRSRGVLICDEAHALKERGAARTKAALSAGGLAKWASHIWLISGTPAPNHAGELYTFLKVAGEWAGGWAKFVDTFCLIAENEYGRKIVGTKDKDGVKALLAPVMLRRTVVEGRPALSVDEMYVEGSGPDPYEALASEHRAALLAALETGNWSLADVPAIATARRLVGLAKAAGTIELAKTCLEGGHHKILIGGTHREAIRAVADGLAEYGARILWGGMKDDERDAIVSGFQNAHSGVRVIVANMASAGEGLTLTAASRVLVFEPDWTPTRNDQFIARAWRRGQKSPVHASFVCLAGSLDGRIVKSFRRKAADVAAILD